ncbi:MAG TPA: NAD(P)H-hydrate dehydratase, partial [Terracidiphilus sp.]|nr:NAD(P)H-hydrate dehydratase [Terracidiphilus sp.]
MRVLSADEMQACDRATCERLGITSFELMRNAAGAVADFAREHFADARRVTVLCGRGNNGGDGMAAARLLHLAGLEVTVILLGTSEGLKGDAAEAWRQLAAMPGAKVHEVKTAEELARLNVEQKPDLIVDAVLGTGFKPPIKGLALEALKWVKDAHTPILAVDLPSGWPADATSAIVDTPVFPADAVVTFTAPKPAHVFGTLTRRWDQPIVVAPIGSPDELAISTLGIDWAGSSMELVQAPRDADSNKGKFGHVLVIGGTFGSAGGKAGAPAMTSLAAMRVGAGLVTAAVPAAAAPVVAAIAPELMTWPLEAAPDGSIAEANLKTERLAAMLAGKTVLALGPGLGLGAGTIKYMAGLLASTQIPTVIDADALNILAANRDLFTELSYNGERTIVLTPHPGEMARLAGTSVSYIQANRLDAARSFATQNRLTLVLKGARTLIAHPNGRVAVNTTGNPGMAKGGSGDLLTGMIAGLLAQYPHDAARAVEAAVYLHGLSA